MFLRDLSHHQGEMHSGRIVKLECHVMIVHQSLLNKNHLLRGAAAMMVDFSTFRSLSGLEYGEALGEPFAFVDLRRIFRLAN